MSRITVQRKATLKPYYQLTPNEQPRKLLVKNDIRKTSNQFDIIRKILLNERNIDNLIQKSNRSEKLISKNNSIHNGKNQFIKKTKSTSGTNLYSPGAIAWNQTKEDNLSLKSAGNQTIKNEPVHSIQTDDRKHSSQSRHHSNSVRSTNNLSFTSNLSKNVRKSNPNASPSQLQKLLNRLSLELTDLESITEFKSNTSYLPSNTCSTALATALITLTGHVRQCASNSKSKQDIKILKDQLSLVIKNQLDFQKKIENQITTLQTMMQTIYQLVNNQIISNKTKTSSFELVDHLTGKTNFEKPQSHQNWLTNAQRPYLIPKDTYNAMDELLLFTRGMNNATPMDSNLYCQTTINPSSNRQSTYVDTLAASKILFQPAPFMSTNETTGDSISKQTQQYRNVDQESRPSMISPIDIPTRNNMFESDLQYGNSSANILRNEMNENSTATAPIIIKETILEKILQERLRLVEQMAELSKQHEMTQLELADLEAKTIQPQTT